MGRDVSLLCAKYGDGLILVAFTVGLVYLLFDVPFLADPVGDQVSRTRFVYLMAGTFVAVGVHSLYTAVYIFRDPERAVRNNVRPLSTYLGDSRSSVRLREKMDYTTAVGARSAARSLLRIGLLGAAFGVLAVVVMT
jgi:hypothetical protein